MKVKYLEDKHSPESTKFDASVCLFSNILDDKIPSAVLNFELSCMAPTKSEAKARIKQALQILIEKLSSVQI